MCMHRSCCVHKLEGDPQNLRLVIISSKRAEPQTDLSLLKNVKNKKNNNCGMRVWVLFSFVVLFGWLIYYYLTLFQLRKEKYKYREEETAPPTPRVGKG